MVRSSGMGLVGRDPELALLGRMMADLVAGRGGAVLVQGDAGIGKSALLESGLASAEALGCQVFQGCYDELTQHFPLSVVLDALGVQESSGDQRRAAAARSLASSSDGSALGMRLASGDPVMAAVEQLAALVDRLCADGPVVLVLEDLHWADEASLVLWWRLARASGQMPLLLVGSCRPWPVPRELGQLRGELREPTGKVIPLTGLSLTEVGRLVQDRVGHPPSTTLARFLQSAEGNPFYVRELIDTLVRSETLTVTASHAELTQAQDWSQVAGSLSAAVQDRLSSLSPGADQALRSAALLGSAFSVGDLTLASASDPKSVVESVREAIGAGVLEADGARLRFRHGLLREVMYHSVPLPMRAALHRQVIEAFIASGVGAERVAELLLPVMDTADGWELGWIVEHAGALVDRAPRIAAQLLEHALDRLPTNDPRRLLAAGTMLPISVYLRRFEQSDRIAREILSNHDIDPEQTGQAFWFMARNQIHAGRPTVVEVVSEALATDRLTPLWRARLAATRALGLGIARRTEEARREAQAALAVGEELSDALTQGYALHILSLLATTTDDMQEGARYADRAAHKLQGSDQTLTELALMVGGNRCGFMEELDEFDRAAKEAHRLLALAERNWAPGLHFLRVAQADLSYIRGLWDDARTQLEPDMGSQVTRQLTASRHACLATIAARRNEWEEASVHINALEELDVDPVRVLYIPPMLRVQVLLAERSGGRERVINALAPCLTSDNGLTSADQAMLLPDLVRAAVAVKDEPTLRAVRDFYDAPGTGHHKPQRHLAGGWWVQGLLTHDPAPVLEAAAYFRDVGRLAWLGGALEDAAVLQATSGDTQAARSTIANALGIYADLGALWDTRRAAARMRAHGVSLGVSASRRRPRTGWAALSDTETRIAAMVAQGLSNPDIAQQLILSRRTVETHVSHILAKLQVHSRREVTPLHDTGKAPAVTS